MGCEREAVEVLRRKFARGTASDSSVRAVLRLKGDVDLSCLERFLVDGLPWVRKAASVVVGQKGDAGRVVEAFWGERDLEVRVAMLGSLGMRRWKDVDCFVGLLGEHVHPMLRSAAMKMFREAGREDCLFPLLFSRSEPEVRMARRCLDEER
jgi:hypothetical protein